jgi:endonuclease YncB( thermonuclease family)
VSAIVLLACLVVSVSDGDTLKAQCPERKAVVTVRLQGIDSPELAHYGFAKMAYQPWGNEAKAALSALCLHQTVDLHRVAIDRNGRSVATLACQGQDVSLYQVTNGNAWVYLQTKDQTLALTRAQDAAKAAKKGLWSLPDPIEPSAWRKAGACSQ